MCPCIICNGAPIYVIKQITSTSWVIIELLILNIADIVKWFISRLGLILDSAKSRNWVQKVQIHLSVQF